MDFHITSIFIMYTVFLSVLPLLYVQQNSRNSKKKNPKTTENIIKHRSKIHYSKIWKIKNKNAYIHTHDWRNKGITPGLFNATT